MRALDPSTRGDDGRRSGFRLIAVGLVAPGLLLVACGGDDEGPAVSSECRSAMREAAGEPRPLKAEPLIAATLHACGSAQEWLDALELHPAAMGLTEEAEIGDVDLQAACYANPTTQVCEDADAEERL